MNSEGRRRTDGYTLLEIQVAVLLMAILFPMVGDVCRSTLYAVRDIGNRAAVAREIGVTVATLARDLGCSDSLSVVDGDLRLQAWRSPLANDMTEIVYALDSERRLWRREDGGMSIVVSTGMDAFRALQVDSTNVRLEIVAKRGQTQRRVILIGMIP